MERKFRRGFTAAEKTELWDRWKRGELLKAIGRSVVSDRLLTVFFQKETGTHFAIVPYRGVAPAMQDLIAGQIDLLFGTPDQLPLMRAGSIKAYAVTSDTRIVSGT